MIEPTWDVPDRTYVREAEAWIQARNASGCDASVISLLELSVTRTDILLAEEIQTQLQHESRVVELVRVTHNQHQRPLVRREDGETEGETQAIDSKLLYQKLHVTRGFLSKVTKAGTDSKRSIDAVRKLAADLDAGLVGCGDRPLLYEDEKGPAAGREPTPASPPSAAAQDDGGAPSIAPSAAGPSAAASPATASRRSNWRYFHVVNVYVTSHNHIHEEVLMEYCRMWQRREPGATLREDNRLNVISHKFPQHRLVEDDVADAISKGGLSPEQRQEMMLTKSIGSLSKAAEAAVSVLRVKRSAGGQVADNDDEGFEVTYNTGSYQTRSVMAYSHLLPNFISMYTVHSIDAYVTPPLPRLDFKNRVPDRHYESLFVWQPRFLVERLMEERHIGLISKVDLVRRGLSERNLTLTLTLPKP